MKRAIMAKSSKHRERAITKTSTPPKRLPPWAQGPYRGPYLFLLARALTGVLTADATTRKALGRRRVLSALVEGKGFIGTAHTMLGLTRLHALRDACETLFHERVPGDLMQAGVWRGGAAIFLLGMLRAYGEERIVVLADSFRGLPKPRHPMDLESPVEIAGDLSVSLATVTDTVRRYGLLEQAEFLPGWFSKTLPRLTGKRTWALLHVDADRYESTRDVLSALYDDVSPGGIVMVDDYGGYAPCKRAVDEFRKDREITAPLFRVDWTAVWWKKP